MLLNKKNTVYLICSFLFIISCLFFPKLSFCLGLEVGPDELVARECPLGQKVAVSALGGRKMKLSIKNKSAADCTYAIDILYTTKTTASLQEGYLDIPDISWIIPEHKEVRIPANRAKIVELYLNIPKDKQYYAKKYQAVVEVKSKKNNPEEIFVLACQLNMYLSTIKAEEVR